MMLYRMLVWSAASALHDWFYRLPCKRGRLSRDQKDARRGRAGACHRGHMCHTVNGYKNARCSRMVILLVTGFNSHRDRSFPISTIGCGNRVIPRNSSSNNNHAESEKKCDERKTLVASSTTTATARTITSKTFKNSNIINNKRHQNMLDMPPFRLLFS